MEAKRVVRPINFEFLKRDNASQKGLNRTTFLALSNRMENLEKISFLPRRNRIPFSEKAQVIATGTARIFTVILPIYAVTAFSPIPRNLISGQSSREMSKSSATDTGRIETSAPVSTRKSNFWYPYLVKTGILMIGSAMTPNAFRFLPNGYSPRINTNSTFGRNDANREGAPVEMLLADFTSQSAVGRSAYEHFSVPVRDEFTAVTRLDFGVRDFRFHDKNSVTQNAFEVKINYE